MAEEVKKSKGRWHVQAKVGDNPNPPTPPPPPPGSGMKTKEKQKTGTIVVRPHRKVKAVMARRAAKRVGGYAIKKYGAPKTETIIWDKGGRKKKR